MPPTPKEHVLTKLPLSRSLRCRICRDKQTNGLLSCISASITCCLIVCRPPPPPSSSTRMGTLLWPPSHLELMAGVREDIIAPATGSAVASVTTIPGWVRGPLVSGHHEVRIEEHGGSTQRRSTAASGRPKRSSSTPSLQRGRAPAAAGRDQSGRWDGGKDGGQQENSRRRHDVQDISVQVCVFLLLCRCVGGCKET